MPAFRPLLTCFALFSASVAAGAVIVIDDFTTGPVVLTDPTPNTTTKYATQSSLPTENVAGGVRHLQLYGTATPSSIQVDGGVMNLNSPNSTTYYTISYNGNPGGHGSTAMLNLNLTGYDRFEVTFSRVDKPIYFQVFVRTGNYTASLGQTASAPGVYSFPLSSWTSSQINWADTRLVYIQTTTNYTSGGSAHTESISDFRVVPEPSGLAVIMVGATALAMLRRGRRS
jgi:hypothetical protein